MKAICAEIIKRFFNLDNRRYGLFFTDMYFLGFDLQKAYYQPFINTNVILSNLKYNIFKEYFNYKAGD